MIARRAVVLAAVVLTVLPIGPQSWLPSASATQLESTTRRDANDRRVIATSVDGRPIVARHYGDLAAPTQLVVLGQMHGNEPGGRKVAARVARSVIPRGVGVWVVASMNPDGHRTHRRANARGVDLNRNFPSDWSRNGSRTYSSGSRAASEPETRGMLRFLRSVRPTAVLSFHQAFDLVDTSHRRSEAAGRRLARWMGERAGAIGCPGPCHGTLTGWVDERLKAVAITVELDSRVSSGEAKRAASAVLRLGRWLAQ